MTSLDGRVALVTGAAHGIGRATAERLLAAGASVVLADLDEAAFDPSSGRTSALTVDLADPVQAAELPGRAVKAFGRLDIVVNNAGIRAIAPFAKHSLEDWNRTIAVNLTAPFLVAQAAVPHLVDQGGGTIVNITSVASELGFTNRSAYNVSKAGLTMLTKSIALELAADGICCNAVAPGVIRTPLNDSYFDDEAFAQVIRDVTPARTWGRPGDIACAVVFLCGDEARFINGTTIHVDGGWSTGKGY